MEQTSKKKTIWKTTDNRFVAFIDILGFKDMIMRSSHDDIYDKLSFISNITNNMQFVEDVKIYEQTTNLHIVNFSDSIAVFSKSNAIDDFMYFIMSVATMIKSIIERGLMVKCGIAYGLTSVNKENRIFFGQPIIDAFLVEEDVNYLGIVCHSTFDKFYEENKSKIVETDYFESIFSSMKSPLKSGKITHNNIIWFSPNLFQDSTEEKWIHHLKSLFTTVSGSPRRYIDNTIDIVKEYFLEKRKE